MLRSKSQALLERLDSWLGPKDRDVSGNLPNDSRHDSFRTGVSVFYFEEAAFKEAPQPGSKREKTS